MALRILSGMIKVPRGGVSTGSFNIGFSPFQMTNASSAGFELRKKKEIGPNGRYIESPASIVTARQFSIVPINSSHRLNINDAVTRDSMTVDWVSKANQARVDLEEVTFMIIGEVPDTVPVRVAGTGTLVRQPSDVLRRKRSGRKPSGSARARTKKKRKS